MASEKVSPGVFESDDDDDEASNPDWCPGLGSVLTSMAMHPKYQQCFDSLHDFLMCRNGPLSLLHRHYIAIMAASRYSCEELIQCHWLQAKELLRISRAQGCEPMELPPKLELLHTINQLLAHRPWMITKDHIQELTRGRDGAKWSLSELVQAVVILCHFHAFSSFVLGCGLMNNQQKAETDSQQKGNRCLSGMKPNSEVKNHRRSSSIDKPDEVEMAELMRRFEKMEMMHMPASIKRLDFPDEVPEEQSDVDPSPTGVRMFRKDSHFKYVDFAKRENPSKYPTFRVQDFSWDDHGFYSVNHFYGEDAGSLLDEKFKLMNELSFGAFQRAGALSFTRAVQIYIQCLFGIRHDDYNYGHVNQLLPREMKKYIKTVSCFPENCTSIDYERDMSSFKNSEKVYVCLLVCESKFQSELLYALRAVRAYYA